MKNPLAHLRATTRYAELMDFVIKLRDTYQIRRLWRQLPLIRLLMLRRLKAGQIVGMCDYVVPYGEGTVKKRAAAAKIELHGFQVGDAHDSMPPGPPGGIHLMRAITQLVQRPVSYIVQELTMQGLAPPRLSDMVDYLAQHSDTVQPNDPLYVVSEEQTGSLQSGRLVYRVLRAQRTKHGLQIDMPQDLPRRKCDSMLLLPAGSRVLGMSSRPISSVSVLPFSSRPGDRTSEPA